MTLNLLAVLFQKKVMILVKGEMPTPTEKQAGSLSPTLYNLCINYIPQTTQAYITHFAEDTCVYIIGRTEANVVRNWDRPSHG
jgi:hypothetical protein